MKNTLRMTAYRSTALTLVVLISMLFGRTAKAQTTYTWSAPSATSWCNTANWTPAAIPGGLDIALFNSNTIPAASGQVTINLNGGPNNNGTSNQIVGAVYIISPRTTAITLGNSTAVAGTLTMNGTSISISGQTNAILANFCTSLTNPLTIAPNAGGTGGMTVNVLATGSPKYILTGVGNTTLTGNMVTISAPVAGSNPLTFLGGGTITLSGTTYSGNNGGVWTLSGANTMTSPLVIGSSTTTTQSGILNINNLSAVATNTAITVTPYSQLFLGLTGTYVAGGTLTLSGVGNNVTTTYGLGALRTAAVAMTWPSAISLPASAVIYSGGALTLTGAVTYTGPLVKRGAAVLTLAGTGTGAGGLTVSEGNVTVLNTGLFGVNGPLTFAEVNGTTVSLTLNNAQQIGELGSTWTLTSGTKTNTLTLASGSTLTLNQTTTSTFGDGAVPTLKNVITGSGAIVKTGTGTLTLSSGGYSHTGTLAVNAGALTIAPTNSVSSIGTGGITLNGGTTTLSGSIGTTIGSMNIGGGNAIIAATAAVTGSTLTISSGNLTIAGSGTTTLSTAVITGGSLTVSGSAATTLGAMTVNNGAVVIAPTSTTVIGSLTVTLGSVAVSGTTTTISSAALINGGSVTLSAGTNTFGSTFGMNGGTLAITGGATKITGAATLGSGGTFSLTSGAATTLAAVTVSGANVNIAPSSTTTITSMTVTSGNVTLAGTTTTIGGAAAISGGTVTLSSGTNSMNSTLDVSNATFNIIGGTNKITGITTLNSGSTISLTGGSTTTLAAVGVNGANVTIAPTSPTVMTGLTVTLGNVTLSGTTTSITGAAAISGGTVTFSAGANTIGTTLGITGGSLAITGGANKIAGATTIGSSGALTLSGSAATTLAAVAISGNATIASSGTTTLAAVTITAGNFNIKPGAGTTLTMGAVTFNGGTINTTGITASNIIISAGALTLSNDATITLDGTTAHQLKFATSTAPAWTAGKKLYIYNWAGTYGAGTAGTVGRVFIGTSNTSTANITATNLGNIYFVNATNDIFPATQIAGGELVPKMSVITVGTITPAGAYYNDVNNTVSVPYTYSGPLSGTLNVELSDGTGSFTTPSVIGTTVYSNSPASATIPSLTPVGTYKIRLTGTTPGTAISSESAQFAIIGHPPVVTSFTPLNAVPGTTVTITGSNFNITATNNKVFFGSVPAIPTSASVTQLVVTVPVGANLDNLTVTDITTHLSANSRYQFVPDFVNDYFVGTSPFSFQPVVTSSAMTDNPWNTAVADFDGDGLLDIAIVRSGSYVEIYRNMGTNGGSVDFSGSTFQHISSEQVQGSVATGIKAADLDGDGKPDLAIATGGGGNTISLLRNITGSYGPTPGQITWQSHADISILPAHAPKVLTIADFDGDGKLDIAAACYGLAGGTTDTMVVLRNSTTTGSAFTSGSFTVSRYTGSTIHYATGSSICSGDFNNDGKIDVAMIDQNYDLTSAFNSSITVFANGSTPGFMSFSVATTLSSVANLPTDIACADVDNDGVPDLILADQLGNKVSVFHTSGSFTFSTPYTIPVSYTLTSGNSAWPGALSVGDINGDGLVDIVATNTGNYLYASPGQEAFSIYKNTNTTPGTLSFSTTATRMDAGSSVPGGIIVADFDKDKYPDVLVVQNTANTFSIFRNKPVVNAGHVTGTATLCHGTSTSLAYSTTGTTSPSGASPAYSASPLPSDLSYTWTSSDGTAATVDPVTGVATAVGQGAVSIIYSLSVTGTNLSATASDPLTIHYVDITPGSYPTACAGDTVTTLSYSGAVGSPITYSIAYDGSSHADGFTDLTDSVLPVSPISIHIPLTAVAGTTYYGSLTLSDGVCVSDPHTDYSVVVSTPPSASIMASNASPCTNHYSSIQFTGTPSTSVDYNVDGGSTQTGVLTGGAYTLDLAHVNAAHTYTLLNVHDIYCTVHYNTPVAVTPVPMKWLGTVSGHETDWNYAANWACGSVPSDTDNVNIPVTTHMPEILVSATGTTGDITIASGVTATLDSNSFLYVHGNVTDTGSIVGKGAMVLAGSSAQTISGINNISNLTLNNSAGASIATASRVTIKSALTLTAGAFATGDSLSMYSDSNGTARIAEIQSGASITGNVKDNQYIQGGMRRYRFWSHPFNTDISLSQLETYIDITGTGGSANGFTPTTTNAPSAFWLNPLTENWSLSYDPGWTAITKIDGTETTTNKLKKYQGIRLFMRGAKGEGISTIYYTPSATTVSMTGPVNQGNQSVVMHRGTTSPTLQDVNMIGNPYPAPVNIGHMLYLASVATQVVGGAYYLYDAHLGAAGQFVIQTFDAGDNFYLPENACFQVRTATDGQTLNFTESMKGTQATSYLFKSANKETISLNIYDNNNHPWDMLHINFNDAASEAEDLKYDAIKLPGADFNFYSLSADNKRLALDVRPFAQDKTIPLGISSPYKQDFTIRVDNINIPEGGTVYLHDKLLAKYVELHAATEYKFTISADKASQGDNRFELSMKPAQVIAKGLQVTMTPNPTTDNVNITFSSDDKEKVAVRVMDMSGVTVYTQDLGAQQNGSVSVPMAKFASGLYMIELTSGSRKSIQKLVKE